VEKTCDVLELITLPSLPGRIFGPGSPASSLPLAEQLGTENQLATLSRSNSRVCSPNDECISRPERPAREIRHLISSTPAGDPCRYP